MDAHQPRSRLTVAAVVAALGALLALPAPSEAAQLAGLRWPGPTIRVWSDPGGRAATDRAIAQWNAARVGIRFRRVSSRKKAHVISTSARRRGCYGFASIGYTGQPGIVFLSLSCPRAPLIGVAAHELGHILGLGHEDRRCALMNSVLFARCGRGASFLRPVLADDRSGAKRLYSKPFRDPFRPVEPEIVGPPNAPRGRPPTVSPVATVGPAGVVTVRPRAADPDGDLEYVTVDYGDGTVDDLAGTAVKHQYERNGTYTIRVVALDSGGRRAAKAVTVTITNAPPPSPDDEPPPDDDPFPDDEPPPDDDDPPPPDDEDPFAEGFAAGATARTARVAGRRVVVCTLPTAPARR